MHAQTLIAAAAALVLSGGGSTTEQSLTPTLLTVKETRVAEIVPPDEDKMTFPSDKPGLRLTFRVPLPDGVTLLDIAEPGAFIATDAAGADLTKVEPGFNGEPDYIETTQVWGEAPTKFTFTLAPATRSAETFSLDATIDATVYETTVTKSVKIGPEWTAVDAFGTPVKARLKPAGNSFDVEMQPGTIKAQVESIALVGGGNETESGWTMWNDDSISWRFDGVEGEPDSIRLVIRQGLRTLPLRVHLTDQPLP